MLDTSDSSGAVQLSENYTQNIAAALQDKSTCDGMLELMHWFLFAVFGKPGEMAKDWNFCPVLQKHFSSLLSLKLLEFQIFCKCQLVIFYFPLYHSCFTCLYMWTLPLPSSYIFPLPLLYFLLECHNLLYAFPQMVFAWYNLTRLILSHNNLP